MEKLKFYSDLFGWKIENYPGPTTYYNLQTVPVDENQKPIRPGANGGLFLRRDAQNPQMTQPTNYFSVESEKDYSKKIDA